ncbi:NAD(P)/FAD-dependent oxidoreductase [Sphingomonas donggukensis]|uniref:Pyridine nucleotide-disulfide oxidoreductase domain-containing protein 2 n=1 Tax=Sphingomonas donggukensis TaxID=2949093 RepID=A0ABY4TWG5_9SPHN|nr:NAD(P)/FAD-dependent oxidoreductase [Sphingomonas donggukensis]URW76683.1 NAD(P)/FAD-dependent oxidoreductase [Sphingomonas donggukensis]
MTARYDAVVVGAGHNGLVCAFYLARAGLKVCVVEARGVVGGSAVTEEIAPGFRNSTASYTVSLLQPRVIADMALHDHGYRAVLRPVANFLPLPSGESLTMGGSAQRTRAEVAKFSARDADALEPYGESLDRIADVIRDLALEIPPNIGDGAATLFDAARQGRRFARLGIESQRDLIDLFTRSARELLDRWFESDPVKAVFGFDAVVGNHAGPSTPGSAYVLLHHVFGEVNGARGAWGHAIGGMGAITQAMASACRTAGVEIRLETPVAKVLVDGGKTAGIKLVSSEEIAAPLVVANVGPKPLYERLVDPSDLPADFRTRIAGYAVGSGTLRMNVALSALPSFTAKPGVGEHLSAGIILAPSLDYMDAAFDEARADGWSRNPVVEMLIPSTLDDSLAPPGAHVASLFCQGFSPTLPAGRDWDNERDGAADAVLAVVERYAPGFTASVVARQIHTPLDLERKFGLAGGDIFHGRMSLDQLWSARPVLGHGSYRAPIAGLWMCGAGTHPGGGVTGAPGHNAAKAILRSRGLGGWWRRG